MLVEAIKKDGYFYIPYLDTLGLKKDRITFEITQIIFPDTELEEVYEIIEDLKKDPKNKDFIKLILKE